MNVDVSSYSASSCRHTIGEHNHNTKLKSENVRKTLAQLYHEVTVHSAGRISYITIKGKQISVDIVRLCWILYHHCIKAISGSIVSLLTSSKVRAHAATKARHDRLASSNFICSNITARPGCTKATSDRKTQICNICCLIHRRESSGDTSNSGQSPIKVKSMALSFSTSCNQNTFGQFAQQFTNNR